MPMRTEITRAKAASSSVTGRCDITWGKTGKPRISDFPRSPCNTPQSHCAYWTGSGSFRCKARRICSASCGPLLRLSPMMTVTISPGMMWISRKVKIEIPQSTGMRLSSRTARKRSIPLLSPHGLMPGAHGMSPSSLPGLLQIHAVSPRHRDVAVDVGPPHLVGTRPGEREYQVDLVRYDPLDLAVDGDALLDGIGRPAQLEQVAAISPRCRPPTSSLYNAVCWQLRRLATSLKGSHELPSSTLPASGGTPFLSVS